MAKANWGRLTDNDMTAISGSRDLLIGKLQTRYGITADRENTALVFGVTAVTCFALGYFWNKLVR